jgi:hypothetical protein
MADTPKKGSGDRQSDAFEEITVSSPDLAEFPHRVTGKASAVRVIDTGKTLASDGTTVISGPSAPLKVRIDENSATEDVFYIGKAPQASAEGSAVWQIKRITVTEIANKTAVDVDYADGNDKFDNDYSAREGLSYS